MFCYSTSAQLERKDRDAAKDAQTHVKVSNTCRAKEHQIAKSSEKEKNCNPRPNQRYGGYLVEKLKYCVTIHRQNSVLQKIKGETNDRVLQDGK